MHAKTLYCFGFMLWLSAVLNTGAGILFSDRFNYPDGPITAPSGSPWVNHGGTAGQVDARNGAVFLTQEESEDVNAALDSGPYTQGTLYLSAVINFTKLPTGDGGFFLHLKDGGSTQKARLYATTNGAPPGSYRLGIANGSTAAIYLTNRLELAQSYRVVIRYRAAAPTESTLWLNPSKEDPSSGGVTATDGNRSASITSIALRQSLATGDGMGSLLLDDLLVGTAFTDVAGSNTPPTLSAIPDQDIGAGESVGPLSFTVGDNESPAEALTLRGFSSNPDLISPTSLAFLGTGASRSVRFQPQPGRQGIAQIRLEVSDGHQQSSTEFQVTVGKPSLEGPSRAEGYADGLIGNLLFTVRDRETPPELLTLRATAANTTLFPSGSSVWTGTGSDRKLELHPAPGRSGISRIDVVVSDGVMSTTNQLEVTVSPRIDELLVESFDRPDGSLITPGSPWTLHAPSDGSPANVQVRSGALLLKGSNTEDFHIDLPTGPFKPESGAFLYAGIQLRVKQAPSSSGSFFAHFRDDQSGFRARITVASKDAPTGFYRIGIASGSESIAFDPRTFPLQESVLVVVKYNVANGLAQLWVRPKEETDPSIIATESATPLNISNWSFRQADGIGELEVDSLRVGGTFRSVVPATALPAMRIEWSGGKVSLRWPTVVDAVLQEQTALGGSNWTDVNVPYIDQAGESSVTLNLPTATAAGAASRFYRLTAR